MQQRNPTSLNVKSQQYPIHTCISLSILSSFSVKAFPGDLLVYSEQAELPNTETSIFSYLSSKLLLPLDILIKPAPHILWINSHHALFKLGKWLAEELVEVYSRATMATLVFLS